MSGRESGPFMVVSGGQTGVDRAALDAALELNIPIGGWCPRGRRSEDGMIPGTYPLKETHARSYAIRTDWNARDSDATLIIVLNEISSGTRLTISAAQAYARPVQIVHLDPDPSPGLLTDENPRSEQLASVVEWIHLHRIRILNVAGPRGSSDDRVYPEAFRFMVDLLKKLIAKPKRPRKVSKSVAKKKSDH
ncbi:MAG: putative molybdenum carrier protein [Planctomycetaceae bacterium]|nr:putative molybdenum carrier protein [Planctomycetaceae bacterium]